MGNAFIVRRGGMGKAFAAISVTYPVGSVCTCTKGTKTFTAKDTSGSYLFLIPEAGTWTVSCTYGTWTKSANIVIDRQYQAEKLILAYEFIIWGDGGVGLNNIAFTSDANVTVDSSGRLFVRTRTSNKHVDAWYLNPINLTVFDRVRYYMSSASTVLAYMWVTDDLTKTRDQAAAFLSVKSLNTLTEFNLDVSNLTGEYYVGVSSGATSSGAVVAEWEVR